MDGFNYSTNESVLLTLSRAYHAPNHVKASNSRAILFSIQTFITEEGSREGKKGYQPRYVSRPDVEMEKIDADRAYQP